MQDLGLRGTEYNSSFKLKGVFDEEKILKLFRWK